MKYIPATRVAIVYNTIHPVHILRIEFRLASLLALAAKRPGIAVMIPNNQEGMNHMFAYRKGKNTSDDKPGVAIHVISRIMVGANDTKTMTFVRMIDCE